MQPKNTLQDIDIQIPRSSIVTENEQSTKIKSNPMTPRQSKYLCHGLGLVGVVAILVVVLAVGLSHEQKTYNGSKEVLQALSDAEGVRLVVTASGPLVIQTDFEADFKSATNVSFENGYDENTVNDTMDGLDPTSEIQKYEEYFAYTRNRTVGARNGSISVPEQSYEIIAIPNKTGDVLKFGLFVTTEQRDGSRFEMSMENGRGYYVRYNSSSGEEIVRNCITQELVPPIDEIANSILKANVLNDKELELEMVDCLGKVLHATWSGHQYLYCMVKDKITSIMGNHLMVQVEYLKASDSEKFKSNISVPETITTDTESKSCAILDLTDAGNHFHTLGLSRRLTENYIASAEEEHWWQHPQFAHKGVRRLSTNIKPYYVSHATNNNLLRGINIIGCTHLCIYSTGVTASNYFASYQPISLSSYNQYVKVNSASVRKLQGTSRSITLPRKCIFIHGAGFENFEYHLQHSHREMWGMVDQNSPCYCAHMRFVRLNSFDHAWYDLRSQWNLCLRLLYDLPYDKYRKNAQQEKSDRLLVNHVIFTHFTSTLTFGAALTRKICNLDSTSRWISIQAPATDTLLADKLPTEICSTDNVRIAQDILQKTSTYSEQNAQWFKKKQFMFNVISTCAPYSETDKQLKWLKSLQFKWEHSIGSPKWEYLKAIQGMGKWVNAALCGISARGMISSSSEIIKMAKSMRLGESKIDRSDGITPIDSCTALQEFKLKFGNEDVAFGSHYTDKYYMSTVAHSDIPLFADSKTDANSKYRKWMNALHLITDA